MPRKLALLGAALALMVALAAALAAGGNQALAQETCAIPEGCDTDGDGVVDTPAGGEVCAVGGQYDVGDGCATPEPSAPPEDGGTMHTPDASPGVSPPAGSSPASAPVGAQAAGGYASATASAYAPADGDAGAASGAALGAAANAASGAAASTTASTAATASVAKRGADGNTRSSGGIATLPGTGGASALVLAAGVLLVGGGLLLRVRGADR